MEFPNRHFYAVEAVEGIVMQLFLLEVRKRCLVPSILWLHDGFWIDKNVDDVILMAAERHVRSFLFPQASDGDPLFRIVDLTEPRESVAILAQVERFKGLTWTECPSFPNFAVLDTSLLKLSASVWKIRHCLTNSSAKDVIYLRMRNKQLSLL